MTTYTTKNLSAMNATEIKSIAKNEFKLSLSSNGKRFTKLELVSSIMKEQSKRKRKVTMETKKNITILNTTKLESIVAQTRKLLSESNGATELQANVKLIESAIDHLNLETRNEKKNMFQNKKRNNAVKLMTIMLKSFKNKSVRNA